MKPLSLAMLLAPVVLGSLANDAGAQGAFRNVSLAINVASHKPNGAAWDAFGGAPDNHAELCAKVLDTLERGGVVAVVDEADNVVDELERCHDLFGGWTVRLKNTR